MALSHVLGILEEAESISSSEFEQPDREESRQGLYRLATVMSGSKSGFPGMPTSLQPIKLLRYNTLGAIAKDNLIFDPQSPNFGLAKWLQYVVRRADQAGVKTRRAGFTFKQLTVSGSGSALNFQRTVGSPLIAPFRIPELARSGKTPQRTILRDFDGVVKPREMLIVLGRPGSGCSTFLKTIAGETAGLDVEKESVIHYNAKDES